MSDTDRPKTPSTNLGESVTEALNQWRERWLAASEEARGAQWGRLLKAAQKGEELVFHADTCTYMHERVCNCTPAHVIWPGDKLLPRA